MNQLENDRQLTARQQQVYDFICQSIFERGIAPTFREMADHINAASPSAVVCHIRALARKGYIERERTLSRGIRPITDRCPYCGRDSDG